MLEKNRKILYFVVITLVMLIGIALRVIFYSYGRPFWNDESALALNLIDRSFLGLFLPLDYSQLTPPLYAAACKFFSLFINNDEYAFRVPSLICSLASLPVFYMLSQKLLKNKCAQIFAYAVFALNYHIIYYAQELKQYSCDVFLFLAILLSYFYIDCEKPKSLIFLGIFYAVSMWFSYTALFALFVVFVLLFVKAVKSSGLVVSHAEVKSRFAVRTYVSFRTHAAMFLSLFGAPLASFGVLYMLVKRFASDTVLHDFWADGFVAKNLSNLPKLIYNNMIFYFPDLQAKILLVLLFAAGFVLLVRNLINFNGPKTNLSPEPLENLKDSQIHNSPGQLKNLSNSQTIRIIKPLENPSNPQNHETIMPSQKELSLMLLLCVGLAFFLSYFNIYPLYLRTSLYLFGAVVLILACAFEYRFFARKTGAVAACLITLFFVFVSLKTDWVQIVQKNYYKETTLEMLEIFKKNAPHDAKLVVPSLSGINYDYYGRFAKIDSKRVYYMRYPLYDYEDIKTAYDMLPAGSTYYVIVTHSGDKSYEKENLLKYASTQKEPFAVTDKFDNALIRFKK